MLQHGFISIAIKWMKYPRLLKNNDEICIRKSFSWTNTVINFKDFESIHSRSSKMNWQQTYWGSSLFSCRTRMANSALKCRIIILITARSLCNYNNILINFGHVYSMWISSTLGSEALYLSHILAPHKMTSFLPNWPCRYGMIIPSLLWNGGVAYILYLK